MVCHESYTKSHGAHRENVTARTFFLHCAGNMQKDFHSHHAGPSDGPLLVTGLPGVPGWNLFHSLKNYWKGPVVGIRPVANWKAHAEGVRPVDAEDHVSLEALFQEFRFSAVVDASGNCALKACECDPRLSHLLNCDFGVRVARLAVEHGAQLVRLSTDLVFSGRDDHQAPYREEEAPDPVTVYGASMAEAEERILAIDPQVRILRIPLPMGYTPGGHAGAIDWIEWRFRNHRPATLYFDERRSPIYKDDLGAVVHFLLRNSAVPPGIYHCGGPRNASLYQIAQIINAVGGYPAELLMGCMRQEAGPMPPRAGDVTVDSSKLLAWLPPGIIRPWPLDPRLFPMTKDWHATVARSTWGNGHRIAPLLVDGVYIEHLEIG